MDKKLKGKSQVKFIHEKTSQVKRTQLQVGGHKFAHALLMVSFNLYLYSHNNSWKIEQCYTTLPGNTASQGWECTNL